MTAYWWHPHSIEVIWFENFSFPCFTIIIIHFDATVVVFQQAGLCMRFFTNLRIISGFRSASCFTISAENSSPFVTRKLFTILQPKHNNQLCNSGCHSKLTQCIYIQSTGALQLQCHMHDYVCTLSKCFHGKLDNRQLHWTIQILVRQGKKYS